VRAITINPAAPGGRGPLTVVGVMGGREAAGVVLVGGRSSRMGTAKAALEWHGSTLLYRTTALLARTLDGPVVVVAAPGQQLPALPGGVEVVADPVQGRGPVQGIAVGLAAVAARTERAFVCSTDTPFLHPAFVRCVLGGLVAGADVALPFARGFRQPLAAGYRTTLAALTAELVADGMLRPGMLFDRCTVALLDDARLLADADVARLDPDLDSVLNLNEPADYEAARARPPAAVTVALERGTRLVRAATLGALGISPEQRVVTLNGARVTPDPLLPLVAGDTVGVRGSARAGTRTGP
jgi:molybdopterin-guanine dinucleotide biosynthesis protein A